MRSVIFEIELTVDDDGDVMTEKRYKVIEVKG